VVFVRNGFEGVQEFLEECPSAPAADHAVVL
jgi:hypothetical protein